MAQEHRIAIVGIGAIATMHAKAIADIPGATLVAASCRTEAKGLQFAQEHGCQWYSDTEAMLDASGADVVTICTPSGAHLEPTCAALGRGIHVLCEKPLEIDLDRARTMIEAAAKSEARLGGIFPQRFNPVVVAAHAAASQGRLGTIGAATAYVPWWRDDAYYAPSRWQGTAALDGGGAMINQSIHAIDSMLWLAEAAGAGNAVEVFGYTAQRGHDPGTIEVEDTAVATVRFSSGALGILLAATSMWPGSAMRVHLAGREGTIEIHEKEVIGWNFRDEQPEDAKLVAQYGKGVAGKGGAADPMAIDYAFHTGNLTDFLSAIDQKAPSLVEPAEAWKSLALIRAVYESAERGEPVAVKQL